MGFASSDFGWRRMVEGHGQFRGLVWPLMRGHHRSHISRDEPMKRRNRLARFGVREVAHHQSRSWSGTSTSRAHPSWVPAIPVHWIILDKAELMSARQKAKDKDHHGRIEVAPRYVKFVVRKWKGPRSIVGRNSVILATESEVFTLKSIHKQ